MTPNKQTITNYMDAFTRSNHPEILACLSDNVEWHIPGAFTLNGKEAFDKEIENPAFTGSPKIIISRLTEENDVVIAEGRVECMKADRTLMFLEFCDVFEMKDAKIKRLVSYLMEVKQ